MPNEAPPGVDLDALAQWWGVDRPLSASVISGGRSNLTYLVTDGTQEWVLRRPPLGHVLPTAHDMAREFRVISALAGTPVPVPRAVAFCDDHSVLGADFYLMDKVEGVILVAPEDIAAVADDDARRCSQELVRVLAEIHAVDYEAVGLGDFGRPEGYLERQVERWSKQWEGNKTRELPEIDELIGRLRSALPPQSGSSIVHGDYRLDNTLLDPGDYGRITAVLDWEMSTLGDPLADVGLLLVYWGGPGAAMLPQTQAVSQHPGFYSSDELVEAYAKASGRDVDHVDFYVALGYYKLAVILEGIHKRHTLGKTVGEGFSGLGAGVQFLAGASLEVLSG